jgi:hypothetical protein
MNRGVFTIWKYPPPRSTLMNYSKSIRVFLYRSVADLSALIMEEIPSERGCEVVHSVFVLYRSRLLETTVMLLMDIARAANMGCSCRKNAGRNSNG